MLRDLIASNVPAIYIKTQEAHRVDEVLAEIIQGLDDKRGMVVWYPHIAQVYKPEEDVFEDISGHRELKDQLDIKRFYNILKVKGAYERHNIFVFHGFKYYLSHNYSSLSHETVYKLMDLLLGAKKGGDTVILVGDTISLPSEIANMFFVYNMPLPNTETIEAIFKDAAMEYATQREKNRGFLKDILQKIPHVARIAQGLTLLEAENSFVRSLMTKGDVDYSILLKHKASSVAQSDVLELMDVDSCSIDRVVGFTAYKEWLASRKIYFDNKDSGLPTPKGCLLIGMSGVGKSMIAKATGNFLGLPTIRFDFSRVFRPLLGESEEVLEKALSLFEATAPCSVLLDEINLSMAGADGSSNNDSGVMMKLMQMFLTWRQDRGKDVLITATGNSIETLPPMLYRAGRFDQIYFCDLPTLHNRKRLFSQYLKDYGVKPMASKTLEHLAEITEHFSGSEVEHAVINALYSAATDKETVSYSHLLEAVKKVRPISKYHSNTMNRMLQMMATVGVLDVESGLPIE